ncbi:MAG: flagellar export protein FliJ [Spirochaetes bacterium]|jgi:flagellar FliJ protein|nr:flagellar export protein FliJ [Spirochaetota bacterium]
MKKFKFRLQKLLDIKMAFEKQIQHELAREIGKQNLLRDKQQLLRERVEGQQHAFHESMRGTGGNFNDLKSFHRYSEYADMVIASSEAEIEAMQPKINEIRSRLIEASKERKSIEKLKEKKHDEWKYAVNRAEEKELEEINMRIFHDQQRRNSYDT